jgi:cell division inhibitor SepF
MAELSVWTKVVNGVSNFFGGEAEGVEDYDDVDVDIPEVDLPEEQEQESKGFDLFSRFNSGRNSKVVAMPQPQQIMMRISKPTNLDEVNGIISQLKEKNAVVLNLEYVNKDIARRILDSITGAIYALDGTIEKVSNSIFVAAPFNYDIVSDNSKDKKESQFAASNYIK